MTQEDCCYILYFKLENAFTVITKTSKFLRNVSTEGKSAQMFFGRTWYTGEIIYDGNDNELFKN
jgi:hypothetical protein